MIFKMLFCFNFNPNHINYFFFNIYITTSPLEPEDFKQEKKIKIQLLKIYFWVQGQSVESAKCRCAKKHNLL